MANEVSEPTQLARIAEVQPESQSISDFIDWLSAQRLYICETADGVRDTRFSPILESREALLARYFGIDLQEAERERRDVLAGLRIDWRPTHA